MDISATVAYVKSSFEFLLANVSLKKGEADLPKKSVVNISQIFTVNKSDLSEKIGTLSKQRIAQILEGIRLLTEPGEID